MFPQINNLFAIILTNSGHNMSKLIELKFDEFCQVLANFAELCVCVTRRQNLSNLIICFFAMLHFLIGHDFLSEPDMTQLFSKHIFILPYITIMLPFWLKGVLF